MDVAMAGEEITLDGGDHGPDLAPVRGVVLLDDLERPSPLDDVAPDDALTDPFCPLLVACVWAALAIDAIWGLVRNAWAAYSRAPGEALDPEPARPRGPLVVAGTIAVAALLPLVVLLQAGVLNIVLFPRDDEVAVDRRGEALAQLLIPGLSVFVAPPVTCPECDASDDQGARRWLDATLGALEPDAVIVSWWSYSTPLWYGQFVEGRRPDILVVDDRTIVDNDLGDVPAVVASWYGQRPVYIVRLDRDLAEVEEDWVLEPVPGLPPGEPVYRVVGRAGDD